MAAHDGADLNLGENAVDLIERLVTRLAMLHAQQQVAAHVNVQAPGEGCCIIAGENCAITDCTG